MKKIFGITLFTLLFIFTACTTPKAAYQTRTGKKKQKFYNDIQFGHNAHPKKTW